MNEQQLFKNLTTIDEMTAIAARRNFLARLACGSLLAMSGSIAQAAVKHAPSKKASAKPAKNHAKTTSKAEHSHSSHSKHKELAANHKHDKHSHTVLSKHDHHLSKHDKHTRTVSSHDHHSVRNQFHERIAMRERNNSRIHHTLHKDYHQGQMREFALQNDLEEFSGFQHGRIELPTRSNRFIASNGNITHRALSLQNTTTGDSLNVTYFEKGRYLPDALDEINYLYRDHLTDEIHPVDTALLDQLHDLQTTLGVNKRQIQVICGYRSPYTNAHLRRHSHGVAKNSLHMQGRAIDIRMPGMDSRTVRDAALSMARGGVGYYPGSNFVHLDTGGVRTW